jgi:hypothetical protein
MSDKEVAFDGEMEKTYQAYKSVRRIGGQLDDAKVAEVILGDPMYGRRVKMPKWNGPVTMLQEPKVALRYAGSWGIPTSKAAHRQRSEYFARLYGEYDETKSDLVNYACDTYGDHGPLVSGVVHDHFPEYVKDRLRFLSRASNEISDAQRLHAFLSKTKSPSFR